MKKTSLLIMTMMLISAMMSILEVVLVMNEAVGSGAAQTLWVFVFAILIALWCIEDSKNTKFRLPYDYGTFVYFLWPVVLPYYLCRTRGMEGVPTFVGFAGIYASPFIMGLVAYMLTP